MHINDLFGYREYMYMRDNGYIRENTHPSLDLIIYNYTEKAQYDNEWNNVTAQCRGLIANSEGTVIARPFDKFMNYGQNPSDVMLMDNPAVVTDKMDGSLGISWQYKGDYGIATRGSFTSDQALRATYQLKTKYAYFAKQMDPKFTYLFEIIYPENRIVLNYGGRDELVLLGARDIEGGGTFAPKRVRQWVGAVTPTFPYKTLREALEAPPRVNAEGFVVYFPELDYRIKIKQDDYVALHKIVTGLTKRRVWENMKDGKTLPEMLEIIPDEWHDWLKRTYKDIQYQFSIRNIIIQSDYRQIRHALKNYPFVGYRKEFARLVMSGEWTEFPGFMFGLLDKKDITDKIWDLVRPSAE